MKVTKVALLMMTFTEILGSQKSLEKIAKQVTR